MQKRSQKAYLNSLNNITEDQNQSCRLTAPIASDLLANKEMKIVEEIYSLDQKSILKLDNAAARYSSKQSPHNKKQPTGKS